MNNRSIILSEYGHFNLHPQLLANLKIPLDSIVLRTDNSLINFFSLYGNTIAQNCYLKIQNIPEDILKNKKIIISKDILGIETLEVFELNGDVVMKYW
jgi:hypothetical protein